MADTQKIGPNADAFKPVTQTIETEAAAVGYVAANWTEILSAAVTPGEVSDVFAQADVTLSPLVATDDVDLKLQINGTDGTTQIVTAVLTVKTAVSLMAKKANVAAGATTVKLFARGTGQAGNILVAFVTTTVKKA
jgi:hypothetical protein